MNYLIRQLLFCVGLLLFGMIFLKCSDSNSTNIANIGEFAVSQDEFVARYEDFILSTGVKDSPIAREQILNHMVNEILLAKLDKTDHILNSPEYKNSTDLIWKELLLAYYKEKEIYEKLEITDQELREAFLKVNEKVSARHLYAGTIEDANKLYDQVKSGMTFEQLAPLVFEDKELSQNGGYLGYFSWGDMDPSFEEAAYSMKVGEVSRPVQTAYGYSIIIVEDRVRNPILTESEFQRKKNSLRRLLGLSKVELHERDFLNKIVDNLSIEIKESSLKNLISLQNKSAEEINAGQDDVIVTYSGGSLTINDALESLRNLAESSKKRINSELALKAALKGLVIQQWLLNDAKKKEYDQVEAFVGKYDQWALGELIRLKKSDLEKSIQIPDSAVEKYYDEHKDEFMSDEKINVQEILVTTDVMADSISILLKQGEDFAKLAKKYTIRNWAAENDGILGLSSISRFGYFKKYLKGVPLMKVIGPIAVDEFYVIARIIQRESPQQLKISEVANVIVETLRQEQKRDYFNEYIKELRQKYPVEIMQDKLFNLKISA